MHKGSPYFSDMAIGIHSYAQTAVWENISKQLSGLAFQRIKELPSLQICPLPPLPLSLEDKKGKNRLFRVNTIDYTGEQLLYVGERVREKKHFVTFKGIAGSGLTGSPLLGNRRKSSTSLEVEAEVGRVEARGEASFSVSRLSGALFGF